MPNFEAKLRLNFFKKTLNKFFILSKSQITLTNIFLGAIVLLLFFGFYYSSPLFRIKVNNFGKEYKTKTVGTAEYICDAEKTEEKRLTGEEYQGELAERQRDVDRTIGRDALNQEYKKRLEDFINNPVINVQVSTKESRYIDVIEGTSYRFGIPTSRDLSLSPNFGAYDKYACDCAKKNKNKNKDEIDCAWSLK